MENKILIGIVALFLIVPAAMALENCKGTMYENDIPCLLLLPVNTTATPCTTINISIYQNGSTWLSTQVMHEYNIFKCNATFTETSVGTYTFFYGTGDTGTIVVEEDKDQEVYLYIFSLIVFFILVGIGYAKEIAEFVMIAGMLAVIIGIALIIYGFPNLTSVFLRNSVAVIFWGVGAYLILEPAMDFFERWKD